jgi:putative membrane protein
MADAYIPYCGSPPVPGGLTWNLDPVLFAVLLGLLAALLWSIGPSRRDRAFGLVGWGICVLALMSPLCNLSMALFSARVSQHVIMALVAAPLIAVSLGRPGALRRRLRGAGRAEGMAAPLCFAVLLWLWHLPGGYDATLKSDIVYWTMHTTLFFSALWFWRVLMDEETLSAAGAFVTGLATGFQMSILGAVLALNSRALFSVHFTTTQAWGLTPLQDQQLGGMIMWVPAGVLLTGYAIFAFGMAMRKASTE